MRIFCPTQLHQQQAKLYISRLAAVVVVVDDVDVDVLSQTLINLIRVDYVLFGSISFLFDDSEVGTIKFYFLFYSCFTVLFASLFSGLCG